MSKNAKCYLSNFTSTLNQHFISFLEHIHPKRLLFIITNRCNSRCVMCNIWQQEETTELSLNQITEMLLDPVFSEIENVIFSGGEPTLREDIGVIAKLFVEKCPNLRNIDVATNGLIPELAIKACFAINEACKNTNVKFAFWISLDGHGETHERVRGVPNAFKKTLRTINRLKELKCQFDFGLGVHCVVTNSNINGLVDLISWCDQKKIPLSFEIAHYWRRFMNEKGQFHLTNAQKEIFLNVLWARIKQQEGSEYDWMTYRMIKLGKKRYSTCPFVVNALSIHPNGNVYYCPNSEPIGNVLKDKLSNIYYNKRNLKFRDRMKKSECQACTQSLWWYASGKNILRILEYKVIKRLITV